MKEINICAGHMSQGRMRPQWSHVTRADASAVVTCHKGGCVRGGKGGYENNTFFIFIY